MKSLKCTALALGLSIISAQALAHARWVLPSHFILSGDKPHTVTLDVSVSNELFLPDHAFYLDDGKGNKRPGPPPAYLWLKKPNGKVEKNLPMTSFIRKNVGMIELADKGTYHTTLVQPNVFFTLYKDPSGERGRVFGPKSSPQIPQGSTNLKTVHMLPVAESYISRNGQTPVRPTGQGLEWQFDSHPSDLFASEPSQLTLLLNGKPLANTKLQVVKGGTRYRNDRGTQVLTTNGSGQVQLKWQGAGVYLLEVEKDLPSSKKGIDTIRHALYTTLEVNPD